MPILLLCCKMSLLSSELLPSRFLPGMLLSLSLLQNTPSFSLLFLLLPLGHLLFQFDFVFPFGLLVMLNSNVLKRLEPREPRLE